MMTIDLATAQRVFDEADCLANQEDVNKAYDQLGKEITLRLHASNPLIFVAMKGGLIPAGQIVSRLYFPLELSYLHLSRYANELSGKETIHWLARAMQPVEGRSVLVIDDILDEGYTLSAITDYLKAEGANEVLSAVLVHKNHDRKARADMRADFTGLFMPDRYLFGGGMDYKGYWRNAPGIYALKGS